MREREGEIWGEREGGEREREREIEQGLEGKRDAQAKEASDEAIKRFVLCLLFISALCFLCVIQSFSGSVTVTMAGSAQIARVPGCTGKAGHATVDHTNSQTHTSTEQQLPAPTPLHYPCKICGK